MATTNKYIRKPQNVRQLLAESINILRNKKDLTKMEIERHRAIGYLASIALNAMRESDIEARLTAIEEQYDE